MRSLAALPLLALLFQPVRVEGVLRVTTDNVEYCEALRIRLNALQPPPGSRPEQLAEEGQRLCQQGHVRSGIAKLRRALRAARAEE